MKDQQNRHSGGRPGFQQTDEQRKNVKILVGLGTFPQGNRARRRRAECSGRQFHNFDDAGD